MHHVVFFHSFQGHKTFKEFTPRQCFSPAGPAPCVWLHHLDESTRQAEELLLMTDVLLEHSLPRTPDESCVSPALWPGGQECPCSFSPHCYPGDITITEALLCMGPAAPQDNHTIGCQVPQTLRSLFPLLISPATRDTPKLTESALSVSTLTMSVLAVLL